MARKRKEKEYDPSLPEPELKFIDGKPFVTDGWIMGSRIIIKQQPSMETIKYVNGMFAIQVRSIERKAKESGKSIEEYMRMDKGCLCEQ
ncbi:hypothetical protein [Clostridium sp.]|uniref:hypothetical protein n=1 Tax=Clostridium sp. TaxID=1506 RepID=UPI0025C63E78|nr:hypothetical protein [Clostridium sp.]